MVKSMRSEIEIPPDLPHVYADADRIKQVLANLVANAIKFFPEDIDIGIQASISNNSGHTKPGQWIKVSISDNGIGIDEKDFDIVFDRFFQVSENKKDIDFPIGSGLGQSISKEIIAHYGGKIWVESKKGEGSTFHFLLPTEAGQACEPKSSRLFQIVHVKLHMLLTTICILITIMFHASCINGSKGVKCELVPSM